MPIRNPFARRPVADERPGSAGSVGPSGTGAARDMSKPLSFERVDTVGSMASSSTSMRSRRSQDTGDYKMSVVNDSGVYMPPSPPSERDAFWSSTGPGTGHHHHHHHRRTYITSLASLSRSSIDNGASPAGPGRSSMGDIEPFSISRESFDSYRRSFDISAKSPVISANEWGAAAAAGRQSLDSAQRRTLAKPAFRDGGGGSMRPTRFPPADEGFEDVGLDDGRASGAHGGGGGSAAANFIRKRGGFFAKFGSDHAADAAGDPAAAALTSGANATSSRFLGRKRGQSGQGAELTAMDRNTSRPLDAAATPAEQQAQS